MQYCLVLQHSQAALLFQHQNVFSDYFPISAKISNSVIGWWFAAAISKLYFSSPSSKVLENLFYVKTDRSELTVLLALLVCSPSVFLLFHWFCFVLFCLVWWSYMLCPTSSIVHIYVQACTCSNAKTAVPVCSK